MMKAAQARSAPLRLVVADRSASFVDLLAHTLRAAGAAEVFKATDSETAWRYMSKGFAHAAVLDLTLGPRSAPELVVALRRLQAKHAHIPVIGMTATIRRDEVTAATRAGINLVVTKPLSAEMVISRIAKLLAETARDLPVDRIAI